MQQPTEKPLKVYLPPVEEYGMIHWCSWHVVFSPCTRPVAEWKWLSTAPWNCLGLSLLL